MKPLLRDPDTCNHPNPARRVQVVHEGFTAEETIVKHNKDAVGAVKSVGNEKLQNNRCIYIICALCGVHADVSGLKVKDRSRVTAPAYAHERQSEEEQGMGDDRL